MGKGENAGKSAILLTHNLTYPSQNKSGKLSQDTPVLPQVVKLGHAPDKIQV